MVRRRYRLTEDGVGYVRRFAWVRRDTWYEGEPTRIPGNLGFFVRLFDPDDVGRHADVPIDLLEAAPPAGEPDPGRRAGRSGALGD
jgi:hypothetical protein